MCCCTSSTTAWCHRFAAAFPNSPSFLRRGSALFSDRSSGMAIAVAALVGLTACELAETELAPLQPKLVLHAVLSPTAATQVVLLERSWDGDKYIWKTGRN